MKVVPLMTLSALLCTLATCCPISSPEDNQIRFGYTLNKAEKEHVSRRRATVQQCLEKHNITCTLDKVPNIALIGSGGGKRAMVGLLGSVLQLWKEDLLDCMMYLSGVSGSTWCMASLYKEENWSTNLKNVADAIFTRLAGDGVSWKASLEKLKKYYKADTDNYSLTHFWSAIVVPTWVKEIDETGLSAQRGKHHEDPYPIFTVIDKGMKQQKTITSLKNTWVEMTIAEAGYTLAGAFVDQNIFGSKFDKGNVIKNEKEMDMLYIQGLCGSALADGTENVKKITEELWKRIENILSYLNPFRHAKKALTQASEVSEVLQTPVEINLRASEDEDYSDLTSKEGSRQAWEVLQTLVEINLRASENKDYSDITLKMNKLLEGKLDKMHQPVVLLDTMQMEKSVAEEELKRFTLLVCDLFFDWYNLYNDIKEWWEIVVRTTVSITNWKWGTTHNFLYKGPGYKVPEDLDCALLTSETRDYIDAGLKLNSPYFSVLRPERHVDLIVSLDFSMGDPMLTVKDAQKMAKEMGIPFPPVTHHTLDALPKDFYVFHPEDPEDNTTPTVIHMPLFNHRNCGDDYHEVINEYTTFQGAYSGKMLERLKKLAAANVINTKSKLLEEIRKAVNKRRS